MKDILSLLLKLDCYDDANISYKKSNIQSLNKIMISVDKAKDIGLKPTTSLENGLKETLQWFNENKQ